MASAKASSDVVVEPGKVNEVRNQLLLQGDEGLAHRLQNEEYGQKYKWNRAERQVARQDVPLAKVVYSEEEERLQKEQYERLQMEKTRAEEDARIAAQLEREEKLKRDLDRLQEDDVRLAKQMQQEELKQLKMAEEDEKIAMKLQKQELVHRRSERRQRELEDQSIAQRLQERERRLAALINAERELRLQQPRSQQRSPNVAGPRPTQDTWLDDGGNSRRQNSVVTSGAIVFDDGEDESDREERLIQQDGEMAKALQDLELEQTRAARRAADEQLYDIVGSDARLARIMQEQERLEVLRRAEERRLRRAAREYNERMQRQAAMQQHVHTCGAAVQPPEYDPPGAPRYVDPHAHSCCAHHHCEPHHHAVRAVSHDPYCGHMDPNMHHHHHQPQAALPADFLRLDDGVAEGREMRRELGPQSGRPRDVNGPGPVYIGPAGRSQSVREQRNDYYAHETSDPMAQRRSNSKGSGNKSGNNCKQQ